MPAEPQRQPTAPDSAPRRAAVIVSSNSAAAGLSQDRTGPLLVDWLASRGYGVGQPVVVPDGKPVGAELRRQLMDPPAVIITTGGTGPTPDDLTPEMTEPLLDRRLPGLMHALWAYGSQHTPMAVLSRGHAGFHGATLIVNLPGSAGGVRDGIAVLDPLLNHLQAQLDDIRDHSPTQSDVPTDVVASYPAAADSSPTAAPSPGPASAVVHTAIVEHSLDAERASAAVVTHEAGALALFRGMIRSRDSGRDDVVGLDYTCHPDAAGILARTADRVAARFPGVRVWCEHRIGSLRVGEDAILVAVASAHRREAFDCCAALVDEVKATVPIWKEQHYAGGGHDWVGLQ